MLLNRIFCTLYSIPLTLKAWHYYPELFPQPVEGHLFRILKGKIVCDICGKVRRG